MSKKVLSEKEEDWLVKAFIHDKIRVYVEHENDIDLATSLVERGFLKKKDSMPFMFTDYELTSEGKKLARKLEKEHEKLMKWHDKVMRRPDGVNYV